MLYVLLSVSNLKSENLKQLVNLEGTWRFTIGDNPQWSNIDCETKNWDFVFIPQSWESAGYINYDGYAWYRKEFKLDVDLNQDPLFLVLGYIDDVDEVYLNGHLIGTTGIFPPVVTTGFSLLRKYYLPKELLNENNVIAVRVYDEYLSGGITKGPVGIYHDKDSDLLENNLAGYWNFHYQGKKDRVVDTNVPVYVPGYLGSRGYVGLEGSITYTRDFVANNIDDENLWVVLGYIDGVDKVYLNGVFIGTTDEIGNSENRDSQLSGKLRSYKIPPGIFHEGTNKISVELEDSSGREGIFEGPIGLIYKDKLELLRKTQVKKPVNYWEEFIKYFFE